MIRNKHMAPHFSQQSSSVFSTLNNLSETLLREKTSKYQQQQKKKEIRIKNKNFFI